MLDAGTLLLAGLMLASQSWPSETSARRLVQFRVVAGADDTAVLEDDRRLVGNSTLNQRDQIEQGWSCAAVSRSRASVVYSKRSRSAGAGSSDAANALTSRALPRPESMRAMSRSRSRICASFSAQVVQDQTLTGQAFDRIKPRLDGGCLTKRRIIRAQQTRAHRRLRVVEHAEQRCLLWLAAGSGRG